MHFAGELTPDEFWAVMDHGDDEVRRTFAERPAFEVRGWPGRAMVSEWSFGSGIRSVTFLPAEWDGANLADRDIRPRVDVLVDVTEPRRMVAERMAFEELDRTGQPPRLPTADPPTPDAVIDVSVDGVAEPFELWSSGERARAAGRVAGVTVVIEASGHPIEEVSLVRLHDIEELLAERRRWIRDLRGEA
jgi:hypothetical protein